MTRILATCVIFLGLAAVVVLLLALRGESVRDIGLRSPANTPTALLFGATLAVLLFATLEELKRAGVMTENRLGDMASELRGDATLTLARMGLSILIVGFVEEFVFRGFIMDRIAKALGGGALALAAAVLGQALLFGLAHAYQGVEGMVFTGAVGIALALLVISVGRNLWPAIFAHGIFDAARAAYLYTALTA
jgi:membrane protease YdiL (CAAX protease family)